MSSTLQKIRGVQKYLQDEVIRRFCVPELEDRAENFVKLFENYLSPSSHILDIGGGWGFYGAPLERRGHHVVVLDAVKPRFQKVPVVLASAGKRLPFADESFDASLMITMLHHTTEPEKVIQEARRVTQKTLVVIEDLYRHAAGRFLSAA